MSKSSPPDSERPQAKSTKPPPQDRRRGAVVLLVLVLFVVLLSPFVVIGGMVAPGPLTENKTIVIPHGTSIRDIAGLLATNSVVFNPVLFRVAAHFIGNNMLKAGEYQFTPGQSPADIVLMMHDGKSIIHTFTVTEGMTSEEVVRLLKDSPAMVGNIGTTPGEGSLLPETYNYSYGDTREAMIARMQKAMQDALNDEWAKRDPTVILKSPEEGVVMASIIEKETGKPIERPRIAEVFYNRLQHGMRLQSDPTVIYAIVKAKGGLNHELGHDDLGFPSPYNTYMSDGLPPGPICNPGRAALDAAMHPESNDFFYFVADGTGGHVFAHDLAAHNQNVMRWNALHSKP